MLQAAAAEHLEVVRLLCEAGADKDRGDSNENGATALMQALAHWRH